MAKTAILSSGDPSVMAKATELKKELQKLVRTIVDDDDFPMEILDQAKETLLALKELKSKKRSSSTSFKLRESLPFPDEFKCPLSKEFMTDPVILATGQTYDRPFIQKWLKAGNRTCPLTQQVLSHTLLTPNHLIREMILQWCKSQGLELPDPVHYVNDDGITDADRDHFLSLLEKMSSPLPEQKEAARQLRMLTKRMPSFRALFGRCDHNGVKSFDP
ncbi:U-box domain-containing protein 9 [Euphorbia peplus]|nr:U-box domain-containing protein 9 [Euphorbia peplus]